MLIKFSSYGIRQKIFDSTNKRQNRKLHWIESYFQGTSNYFNYHNDLHDLYVDEYKILDVKSKFGNIFRYT